MSAIFQYSLMTNNHVLNHKLGKLKNCVVTFHLFDLNYYIIFLLQNVPINL